MEFGNGAYTNTYIISTTKNTIIIFNEITYKIILFLCTEHNNIKHRVNEWPDFGKWIVVSNGF